MLSKIFLSLQIFDMMDAKARQDCIKEIDLLKVKLINHRYCPAFLHSKYKGKSKHLMLISTMSTHLDDHFEQLYIVIVEAVTTFTMF